MKGWVSWAAVSILALLCGVMAILQYRWIDEFSSAERQRLRDQLGNGLSSIRTAFHEELRKSAAALESNSSDVERMGREAAYSARYQAWKGSHGPLFQRIALAVPREGALELEMLDLDSGRFAPATWPEAWSGLRSRLESRGEVRPRSAAPDREHPPERRGPPPSGGRGFPPPRPDPPRPAPQMGSAQDGVFEIPRFGAGPHESPREQEWLIVEPNLEYLQTTVIPDLLGRYLAQSGRMDYDAAVTAHGGAIYESSPAAWSRIAAKADGSVALWGDSPGASPGRSPGPPPEGRGGPPGGRMGRPMSAGLDWTLWVRHKAGSLEALVEQARQRNLALSAGLLLLIVATVGALVRFSRQAQRLAELQIHFVAGVSHELRTPLTVIRTAAYNLRGRMAERPEQVERYGQLIEDESKKLDALVGQVLQFASAGAGHVIRQRQPVRVEELIEKALESSASARRAAGVVLEKHIAGDLPPVLADELAMRHALQNLIDNALKYGAEGGKWIGVFASASGKGSDSAVDICVADRGPGIPQDEQEQIFDPFYRGRRAVSNQIHGTGLGLDLVKKIVVAHGGSIRVKSAAGTQTEFVMRIPAAASHF